MNILKNVINKLSQEEKKEVNLASEKVELATFADVKTQIQRAESEYDKILKYADRIFDLKKEAKKNTSVELLDRIVRELESDKKEFVSKVKDLGIDPNKLKQPKEYDQAIKKIVLLYNKGKEMYSEDFR
jgi:hypothetical protein